MASLNSLAITDARVNPGLKIDVPILVELPMTMVTAMVSPIARARPRMKTLEIDTPFGKANAHVSSADNPRAALVLGHGAGGGVQAKDLVAVARVAHAGGTERRARRTALPGRGAAFSRSGASTRCGASEFTFLMFMRRFRESNFLKFVVFSGCLTFATYMAAPFFAVFMLRDLQLSYVTYMALQVCFSLAALIALPLWGRHADLVGNVRVLRLSSFLAALIPMFWLFSHNPAYLMLVQIFSGFSWSGVTLSAGNFIYDAVTPQKRVRCIAYFNVINGLALFMGSSLGGYFAARLPPFFGYRLLGLFALSCVCRVSFYLLLSRSFREVRAAHEVSIQGLFFSVVGIRPLVGPARD